MRFPICCHSRPGVAEFHTCTVGDGIVVKSDTDFEDKSIRGKVLFNLPSDCSWIDFALGSSCSTYFENRTGKILEVKGPRRPEFDGKVFVVRKFLIERRRPKDT